MTQTQRPLLQAVLGLDAPLQELEGHSSISAEMLDVLEAKLVSNEQAISDSETLAQTAKDAQTVAETEVSNITEQLSTLATSHEVVVGEEATPEETIDAISAHIVELGKRDAGKPTAVAVETNTPKTEKSAFIDANASHNVLADKINLN